MATTSSASTPALAMSARAAVIAAPWPCACATSGPPCPPRVAGVASLAHCSPKAGRRRRPAGSGHGPGPAGGAGGRGLLPSRCARYHAEAALDRRRSESLDPYLEEETSCVEP